jgi:hypothetical protein
VIRNLHLTDLTRQMVGGRLRGPDHAFTRGRLAGSRHEISFLELAQLGLTPSSVQRQALAMVSGLHLLAVSVVRPRQGPRAWEVARLYVSSKGEEGSDALLEECAVSVGKQGGERLFLRVEDGSPMETAARHTGFVAGPQEEVYVPGGEASAEDRFAMLQMRPMQSADLHDVFRLYNASVPASIRSAYALTMDQWQDARERTEGGADEFVWEREGHLRGWVRVVYEGERPTIDAMLHPDESAAARLLCGEALRLCDRDKQPGWVVQEHQLDLLRALEQNGWTSKRAYRLFIKPLAKPVEQVSMSAVQA